MAPVEQRQGHPERCDLDEREDCEGRSRQRQVCEPEGAANRDERQRHRDRCSFPDTEVRFVRRVGTDVENADELHRTD